MEIDEIKLRIDHESTQIELKESQISIQEQIPDMGSELDDLNKCIKELEDEIDMINRDVNTKSVENDHLKNTIVSLKRSQISKNSDDKNKLNLSRESEGNSVSMIYKAKEMPEGMVEVLEEPDETKKSNFYHLTFIVNIMPFSHEDIKSNSEFRSTNTNTSHILNSKMNDSTNYVQKMENSIYAKVYPDQDVSSLTPQRSNKTRSSTTC